MNQADKAEMYLIGQPGTSGTDKIRSLLNDMELTYSVIDPTKTNSASDYQFVSENLRGAEFPVLIGYKRNIPVIYIEGTDDIVQAVKDGRLELVKSM